jgi:hypothetical protein
MAKVEFCGQSARDSDNIAANPSRLINAYREPVVAGGRTGYAIKSVLGLSLLVDVPGVFVRAMAEIEGALYVVCGGILYRVTAAGAYTALGSVTDSAETSIAGNNGLVTVCAGGAYYVWDGTTLSSPTPGAFSSFGGLDYLGNYTILTEKDGRRFQWSNIADAEDLPGLNFSTADGRDDNLIRPFAINGQLYLFKQKSHEIWYITGAAGASAFERQAGGVYDIGLKAFRLLCAFPGAAFFVGSDGRAHLTAGGGLRPVSIPAVETAIKDKVPLRCVAYEDEGHTFCAIVFRNAPAWVLDVATGEWHERAERWSLSPWTVSATAKAGGVWYAGRDDGRVFTFSRNNADGDDALVREITSRTLDADGQRFILNQLEIFPRQGFASGEVALSVSRDGGLTWGGEQPKEIGPVGQYGRRVIWRRLGQARQFTVKLRWTTPADISINAEGRVSA